MRVGGGGSWGYKCICCAFMGTYICSCFVSHCKAQFKFNIFRVSAFFIPSKGYFKLKCGFMGIVVIWFIIKGQFIQMTKKVYRLCRVTRELSLEFF